MKLTLETMIIDNFKGCRHLELTFSPKATRIAGRNGLGKTTIADAFFWLLLNKDSGGNAPGTDDFREKPLDEHGEEIHDLETAVTLVCKLDGEPFTLRRVQKENWVKQRGKSEAKYAGNESSYTINEVPVKLNEFKSRIAAICPDGLFSYVTMLSAFNMAPWQERRKVLLSMSGLDVDKELLAKAEYADLDQECITRGVTMEDLKKVLQASLRDLNGELKLLPARIDEAQRSLPEFGEYEVSDAKENAEQLPDRIAGLDEKIAAMTTGSEAAKRAQRLLALRTELTAIQNAVLADHERGRRELQAEVSSTGKRLEVEKQSLSRMQEDLQRTASRLEASTAQRAKLREEYQAEYSRPFSSPADVDVCPTCGQQTPPEYRERLIEAAKKSFMDTKRQNLSAIQAKGQAVAAEIDRLEKVAQEDQEKIAASEAIVSALEEHLAGADAALGAYPTMPDYSTNPRYGELKAQIEALQTDTGKDDAADDLEKLRQQRTEMQAMLDRSTAVLARVDAGKQTQLRIGELRMQQHQVGSQVARLEKMIMLCEQFVKDRCALLEETINGLFPSVRWKLFNQQINGGLSDCCMCMIPCGGRLVPYGSDESSHSANTAARLHADVEIVDALSKHFDVRMPLFFDGKERVNEVPPFDGQLITLEVSTDSDLRVEAE